MSETYNMNELQKRYENIKENIAKQQNERKEQDKQNAKIMRQIKNVEIAEAKALKEKIKLNKLLNLQNSEETKDEK